MKFNTLKHFKGMAQGSPHLNFNLCKVKQLWQFWQNISSALFHSVTKSTFLNKIDTIWQAPPNLGHLKVTSTQNLLVPYRKRAIDFSTIRLTKTIIIIFTRIWLRTIFYSAYAMLLNTIRVCRIISYQK